MESTLSHPQCVEIVRVGSQLADTDLAGAAANHITTSRLGAILIAFHRLREICAGASLQRAKGQASGVVRATASSFFSALFLRSKSLAKDPRIRPRTFCTDRTTVRRSVSPAVGLPGNLAPGTNPIRFDDLPPPCPWLRSFAIPRPWKALQTKPQRPFSRRWLMLS